MSTNKDVPKLGFRPFLAKRSELFSKSPKYAWNVQKKFCQLKLFLVTAIHSKSEPPSPTKVYLKAPLCFFWIRITSNYKSNNGILLMNLFNFFYLKEPPWWYLRLSTESNQSTTGVIYSFNIGTFRPVPTVTNWRML